ncbi:hypothetical protein BDN70DRAFT_935462 [Pholiota conissans]|uniref:Uncharacterized protein n=1 Tax=Pholiota conissans TaxID=109636 RepID=A0A9P5YXV0_9AGAR|nr:hypothetical protein BDN70DRAFT_935462 [Pholiota conissans]
MSVRRLHICPYRIHQNWLMEFLGMTEVPGLIDDFSTHALVTNPNQSFALFEDDVFLDFWKHEFISHPDSLSWNLTLPIFADVEPGLQVRLVRILRTPPHQLARTSTLLPMQRIFIKLPSHRGAQTDSTINLDGTGQYPGERRKRNSYALHVDTLSQPHIVAEPTLTDTIPQRNSNCATDAKAVLTAQLLQRI